MLGRDPHVTMVDFDASVIEKQTNDCGSASCPAALAAACAWAVGGDAGYVLTGTFDSWDGTGFPLAKPMSVRSPIARVYAGFDL